jgi:hypothetical protein
MSQNRGVLDVTEDDRLGELQLARFLAERYKLDGDLRVPFDGVA